MIKTTFENQLSKNNKKNVKNIIYRLLKNWCFHNSVQDLFKVRTFEFENDNNKLYIIYLKKK